MDQLQKYTWLIDKIRRAGRISLKELSNKWERNTEASDGKPLNRTTFNRWRDAIFNQFDLIIDCEQSGDYRYFIANPEDIEEDKLKKWMLDSFAAGTAISENLALKGRILVDEIPSGREHLTDMLEAMKDNRVINITYKAFTHDKPYTFRIEPYCVKLFQKRWYVLAHNAKHNDIRLYALDRVNEVEITKEKFKIPKNFNADEYYLNAFGIVIDPEEKPTTIVLRAYAEHKHYLNTLPLHHSQRMIEDCDEYADFELYLSPTYDFVMQLLHVGAMVEVIKPTELRKTMKGWISEMYELYKND